VENLQPLRSFYLWTVTSLKLPIDPTEIPEPPPLSGLKQLGWETIEEKDYRRKLGLLEEWHRLPKGLVIYTGWEWQDVVGQRFEGGG